MMWRLQWWKNVTAFGYIVILLPIIGVFIVVQRELGIKLLFGVILIYIIITGIRLVYFKERPKKRPVTNILRRIDAASFPSSHATRAFFFAVTITRYYQSRILGIILFIVAIMIAYSRYKLHEHYASDVIGGAVLGIVISYVLERAWLIGRVLGL